MEEKHSNRSLIFLLAGIAILMIAGGVYYLTTRPKDTPPAEVETPVTEIPEETEAASVKTYRTASGLSFMYPSTYVAISPEMLDLRAEEVVNLFDRDDYEDLESSTEPREGPPSISLQVFDNPDNQSAGAWIQDHAGAVNYDDTLGRLQPRRISGEDAVAYRFTGLYEGDAMAFVANGKMYLFMVTWMGPNDRIRDDFEDVLNSIKTP